MGAIAHRGRLVGPHLKVERLLQHRIDLRGLRVRIIGIKSPQSPSTCMRARLQSLSCQRQPVFPPRMGLRKRFTCISISNWVSLYKGLTLRFIPKLWHRLRLLRVKPPHLHPKCNSKLKVMSRVGFKPLSNKRKPWFQRFQMKLQSNLPSRMKPLLTLRHQNEVLARQQQDLYSQIATLQNMVAEVKATAVNTSVPQIPQTQNGAEITEALKAMASHVGQTMNELKDAVLSGSASNSPKAKGRKNRSKDSDSSADKVPTAKTAKAPYFSNPPPYTCERRPPLVHDAWACPPAPAYACGRLPTSSTSANASPVFTTPFASLKPAVGKAPFSAVGIGVGLASTATPYAGPPGPPPPAPPEIFNIGDPDEGEEEEQVEDDPVIDPRVVDDGDAQGGAAADDGDYEGATYRYKDLKDLKLPQLPKDSVGFRSWRNALLTQFAAIDRTGQARVLRWLQICVRPEVTNIEIAFFQNNPEQLPRLDSYLASQLSDARHMKGEFGLEVQAYIERAHSHGVLPSGRAMLAMLSRRFRVDRVRGATVTQQTLLAITLDGFSYGVQGASRVCVEWDRPRTLAIR